VCCHTSHCDAAEAPGARWLGGCREPVDGEQRANHRSHASGTRSVCLERAASVRRVEQIWLYLAGLWAHDERSAKPPHVLRFWHMGKWYVLSFVASRLGLCMIPQHARHGDGPTPNTVRRMGMSVADSPPTTRAAAHASDCERGGGGGHGSCNAFLIGCDSHAL